MPLHFCCRAHPHPSLQSLSACLCAARAALPQVHRQSEVEFIELLHAIRDGSATLRQLDRLWSLCSRRLPQDDGIVPTREPRGGFLGADPGGWNMPGAHACCGRQGPAPLSLMFPPGLTCPFPPHLQACTAHTLTRMGGMHRSWPSCRPRCSASEPVSLLLVVGWLCRAVVWPLGLHMAAAGSPARHTASPASCRPHDRPRAAHRVKPKVRRGEDPQGTAVRQREHALWTRLPEVLREDRKVKEVVLLKEGAQVMCTVSSPSGHVQAPAGRAGGSGGARRGRGRLASQPGAEGR